VLRLSGVNWLTRSSRPVIGDISRDRLQVLHLCVMSVFPRVIVLSVLDDETLGIVLRSNVLEISCSASECMSE